MEFDYVIVGGGSAGSVMASALKRRSGIPASACWRLAVMARDLMTRVPVGAAVYLRGLFGINNWAFQTAPQKGLNGRRGFQPRGKGTWWLQRHQCHAICSWCSRRL